MSFSHSSVIGFCMAGRMKFAVRWNTVTLSAFSHIAGTICTVVAPAPMMPMRLPSHSRPSGQREEWKRGPWKLSMPGIFGITGSEIMPIALTKYLQV